MGKFLQFRWSAGPVFSGHAGAHFGLSHGSHWQPPMNAYRCKDGIRVCFDLAGVDKKEIDIEIEPGRLVVQGVRKAPEPSGRKSCAEQILSMEIDHGRFRRELRLPSAVIEEKVTAEYNNGMLWIHLPLRNE